MYVYLYMSKSPRAIVKCIYSRTCWISNSGPLPISFFVFYIFIATCSFYRTGVFSIYFAKRPSLTVFPKSIRFFARLHKLLIAVEYSSLQNAKLLIPTVVLGEGTMLEEFIKIDYKAPIGEFSSWPTNPCSSDSTTFPSTHPKRLKPLSQRDAKRSIINSQSEYACVYLPHSMPPSTS